MHTILFNVCIEHEGNDALEQDMGTNSNAHNLFYF